MNMKKLKAKISRGCKTGLGWLATGGKKATVPYKIVSKWVGDKIEAFVYPPALPDLSVRVLYEKLMMDYIDHPDNEMFADFRLALTDYLNRHPSVSNLDLGMVVRQWFIINTPSIEDHWKVKGKQTAVVSLQVVQDVTDMVIDYFKYNGSVTTDEGLSKFKNEEQ